MLCCSFLASLMASRSCSWKRTCSAMSASVTPSAETEPGPQGTDGGEAGRDAVVVAEAEGLGKDQYAIGGQAGREACEGEQG